MYIAAWDENTVVKKAWLVSYHKARASCLKTCAARIPAATDKICEKKSSAKKIKFEQ